MDTKTPPIPQKHQPERVQSRKPGRACEVSLPPLTPPPNHFQKPKPPGSPWVRNAPGLQRSSTNYHNNYRESERPYRVLNIGATPLMHACQQGDRSRVQRLLKEQRNTIGFRDRTLRSALHYCMDAGTGGAVATAAPELVNAPDAEGHTPLHLAVIAGDSQLVAVLLANGAEVNVKDLEGHSVLHWATVCGEIECVRLVLASGARPSTPDTRGGSPLHYAAQCCGAAATAELAVPKKVGLKVLQTLLDYGADCNAKDADGRQPILWAASAGSVEAVLALARAGGSASAGASDKDGLTALHCAASRGHTGCVEALVNLCGSQPDHVDDNGCSALHYAATLGHADATALLLRLGADPNRQDRKGRTPALCAAAKGQLETLKILAQHGGSLHARTVRGSGVAHEAAASGRVELIKWLAKKRSGTLDIATHDGRTPLHVAALHGHVDTCKVLLDNGARANAILRTSKGNRMTALDAALYRGHRDCAKLIQMHGGTTAQQIRSQKVAPYYNEFSTKLRMKRSETTSNSDNDSEPKRTRRRRGGSRGSELYYEEHWEKRRTRRRDSPRKSERTGSRSYSEEELRASKETRRSRGRRTRSESARYESGKRKDRVRRKGRHDYTESSTMSGTLDSSESEGYRQSSRHRKVSKKRSRLKHVAKAGADVKLETDTPSVSEDGLEVVVVRKSIEKKSEKVISGRRSKTPRDHAGATGKSSGTKNHPKPDSHSKHRRRTSRKTPTDEKKARDEAEQAEEAAQDDEVERGTDNGQSKQGKSHDAGSKSDEGEARNGKKIRLPESEVGYQIDAADSTSQEAVEQVVVTAMVHKDQASDTPKSTSIDASSRNGDSDKIGGVQVENGQEQTSESNSRSPRPNSSWPGGASSRSRMEHILEKADEMQNILIQKAADLKKGIEDWREHVSEEMTETGDRNEGGKVETDDVAAEEVETSGESKEMVGSTREEDDTSESIVRNVSDDQTKTERDSHDSQDKADEATAGSLASSPPLVHADAKETREIRAEEDKKQDISSLEITGSPVGQEEPLDNTANQDKSVISDVEKTARRSSNEKFLSRSSGSKSRSSTTADKVSPDREPTTSPGKSSRSSRGRSSVEKKSSTSQKTDRRTSSKKSPVSTDQGSQEDEKDTSLSSLKKLSFEVAAEDDWSSKDVADDSEGLAASRTEDRRGSWEGVASGFEEPRRKSGSRPSTAKHRSSGRRSSSSGSPARRGLVDRSDESSPIRGAIVAVIESPEWAEDEEEAAIDNEIREAIGDDAEMDTDFEDNSVGVMRVLPSTSDDETPRTTTEASRGRGNETLPQVAPKARPRLLRGQSPCRDEKRRQQRILQRRDSGGRDSGIEPSPRISRIPRRTIKCYPNTEKQQSLNMETVTRDVQISLRRYHLERKIFFQLMELKRLQIRHGRANEHVLIKRQVEAFHKAGTSGPALGVAKYDQPLTFRHFEAFLYEQLRRLQKRPGTPDWCADPKYCTQKTHRCHHATSAYTSLPIYTYLGGVADRGGTLLPSIDARGRGHMTVEVSHSTGKQVIALPAERLDRSKRYFVTFTVRGDSQDSDKQKSSLEAQRTTKSI